MGKADVELSATMLISRAAGFRIFGYNALILALFAVAAYLQITVVLHNHDIAWLLIAASRLADGGNYATDFFEVNPPLILFVYMPAVFASRLSGIDSYTAVVLLVLIYTGISLAAAYRMASSICPEISIGSRAFHLAVAAILLFTPGYDFGQREHLIVIFALPYLILMSAAQPGYGMRKTEVVAVVAWAALGLFLKPTYILLPVLIAITRSIEKRSPRALLSLDMVVFALLGVLYLVFVAIQFPEYFVVAGYAARVYSAFDGDSGAIALATAVFVIGGCLPALVSWRVVKDVRERKPVFLLALGAVVGGCAILLQNKGWSYHFLPTRIFGGIAAVMVILAMVRRTAAARDDRYIAIAFIVALSALAVGTIVSGARSIAYMSLSAKLEEFGGQRVADLFEGRRVSTLSRHVPFGLPWIPQAGGEWASRFSCLWLLPGYSMLRNDESVSPKDVEAFAADLRRFMVEDFEHYRPEIVVVDMNLEAEIGFQALSFYLADARFVEIWKNYRYLESVNDMEIYVATDIATEVVR